MPLSFSRSVPAAPLLGLLALAAQGLAANPAQAQTLTLNNDDSLTVSSAGTVGTQDNQPVNSPGATSYNTTAASGSAVQINDTSTFTLGSGGSLSAGQNDYGLIDYSGGAVTITGGSISAGDGGIGMAVYGSSVVTITGGAISTGGNFGLGLAAEGSGAVTITGGTFSAGQNSAALDDEGSGGVTITGGTFSAGSGGYGLADASTTLNLFSLNDTPFLINGNPFNNTTLNGRLYQSGTDTISGTLENGNTLNTTFQDLDGAINLNPGITPPASVPELSSAAVLSFGILGLSGLILKAKRRKAAA